MGDRLQRRERVLWAAATLVERDWGAAGGQIISDVIDELVRKDDVVGVQIWLKVSERFAALQGDEMSDEDAIFWEPSAPPKRMDQ